MCTCAICMLSKNHQTFLLTSLGSFSTTSWRLKMSKQNLPLIFVTTFLLLQLLSLPSTITLAQEVEDESEFDYLKESEKGPHRWGELKEEWTACKHGKMQSPIDLASERVTVIRKLEKLRIKHKPANATIKNRGHDISIHWVGNPGSIKINKTDYELQQCHWHSHSEHTINGRRFDLEVHMVHLSKDPNVKNNIVVIGGLYKIGAPNRFIRQLTKHIVSVSDDTHEERNVGVVNPRELLKMKGRSYYRYIGSLTVPPCTEGVTWIINTKVMTVSKEQVELLQEAVHDHAEVNARPLQLLNDRKIHLYGLTKYRKGVLFN